MTEDEMVGWHHRLNRHEIEQTPGFGEGQGRLVLQSMGLQRVGHKRVTSLCFFLYFANKGPSSQSYGFSSGHVWM